MKCQSFYCKIYQNNEETIHNSDTNKHFHSMILWVSQPVNIKNLQESTEGGTSDHIKKRATAYIKNIFPPKVMQILLKEQNKHS